jgi:PHD/YefM family antitoxin component YafN of YafNO toxin-antitoxin module
MTTKFQSYEVPIAYSMIATARRIRPRRDGQHPFEQYFLFWTAFNNIYSTIADRKGRRTHLKENEDGSIVTIANGNVDIPEVVIVSESEQIQLAFQEFTDDLKHGLILHEGTKYFVGRIPSWQGKKIAYDASGQRVNGVINVNCTSDSQYPVWSPIDFQYYEEYLENPNNQANRDFLARQIVDLLFTIRQNFMYGGKRFDDANDIAVVENGLPMLELIVSFFT